MVTPEPAAPRVIVALDFSDAESALSLATRLDPRRCAVKIGKELIVAAGPQVVREIVGRGFRLFLDLKFHDIPNTVAGGVRNATKLGARLVTVHATGGEAMLRAAVDAAAGECGVLAVTLLTSLSSEDVAEAWGRPQVDVTSEVLRLADVAARAGAHGVVCSGLEAARVRDEFGEALAVLVPGVRAAGGAVHDQARVVSPQQAAAAGARYAVVGRIVTAASDRRAAMQAVAHELE